MRSLIARVAAALTGVAVTAQDTETTEWVVVADMEGYA